MKYNNVKDFSQNRERPLDIRQPTISKQRKHLSLKHLPFDKEVSISKCWIDRDDAFDYGERLE